MQGVLHMSKRNSQEGSVHVGNQGSSLLSQILIKGKPSLNRAMHGDTVAGMTAEHSSNLVGTATIGPFPKRQK